MATIEKERIAQLRGQDVLGRDDEKIGSLEEIYLDAQSNGPEWALVNTGLFGTKSAFVRSARSPTRFARSASKSKTTAEPARQRPRWVKQTAGY